MSLVSIVNFIWPVLQVVKRQTSGAGEFHRTQEVDNDPPSPNKEAHPVSVWGRPRRAENAPRATGLTTYSADSYGNLWENHVLSSCKVLMFCLCFTYRFVCTCLLAKSASTSETARLHTAQRKGTCGHTWKRTTVSSCYRWTVVFVQQFMPVWCTINVLWWVIQT